MSADVWALMPDGRGNPHVRNNRCDAEGCHVVAIVDPEDREAAHRLLETYGRQFTDWTPELDRNVDRLQAALREFANPKPPKPAEPTGLGAVVEDANSVWLVRLKGGHWADGESFPRPWSRVTAVRVLSEGVQS